MSSTDVLTVHELKKRFGKQTVVDGVSFKVSQGEIVSLLGPSGCGKTTILRCVAGMYQPDGGSISLNDQVIASETIMLPPQIRGFAMVFQNYVLWPHMTVFNNIAYGLRIRRLPRAEIATKVRQVVELLGLAGLQDRYPASLSGGQQQRVSVARSLVVNPTVYLLDEPFSNLDTKLRLEMRHEIQPLLKRLGTTTIFVTHDQEEAMALSDRIVLLKDGEIVQEGTPTQIFEKPNSEFTARFFGISNFISGQLVREQGRYRFLASESQLVVELHQSEFRRESGPAVLAVRDDAIIASPIRAPNSVPGRIIGRSYLGGGVQLAISYGVGGGLRARVAGSVALEWPIEMFFTIDPAGALVIPDRSVPKPN
jgi:ABC-type Fe3+/spermidine/putrescine transport system ATPase subunit